MLTTAGRGVEYFWTFSHHRYFLPVRVIESSSLSITRFFQVTGGRVLHSELLWVWVPCLAAAFIARAIRKGNALYQRVRAAREVPHFGARPARFSFCAVPAPRGAAAGRSTRALGVAVMLNARLASFAMG